MAWRTVGLLMGVVILGAASPAPVLTVGGSPTPLALSAADLQAMPRGTAVLTAHGKTAKCEGVWLADVLVKAGVAAGESVKGPALSQMVMAEAADGYQVVFSLGEIDRLLGNGRFLVADRCGGAVLQEGEGPLRIVAEGEKRAARSVRALVRLTVMPAGETKATGMR